MPPSSSSTFSWRRFSSVVMSEPQVLDVDIAMHGHLAGQALIRRGTQAVQEVAFLGPHPRCAAGAYRPAPPPAGPPGGSGHGRSCPLLPLREQGRHQFDLAEGG